MSESAQTFRRAAAQAGALRAGRGVGVAGVDRRVTGLGSVFEQRRGMLANARHEAQISFQKEMLFRFWTDGQGGSAPDHVAFSSVSVGQVPDLTHKTPATPGKFIKNLNYTGLQASIVHVEINARDGRNIYVDRDYPFAALPADLVGADSAQVADADQRYSAVDFIELAVTGGTVVSIAHDERAPLPGWLTKQFQATAQSLTINGQPMKIFQRLVARDESITFGSNTDGAPVRANMYVVLVNGK
jgi:hypothetical protein